MKALKELVTTVSDFTPAQVMQALSSDLADKIAKAEVEKKFRAKYIAMDADGAVFIYASKPEAVYGNFMPNGYFKHACIDAFEAELIIGGVVDYTKYILEL